MIQTLKKDIITLLFLFLAISGCKDPWEERVALNDDVPANNLLEEIQSIPEISQFAALLESSGWDTILTSTSPHTVWAPTNDAMGSVGSDILNNPDKLSAFINNHISFLKYEYLTGTETERVFTYSQKYITLDYVNAKAEDASLVEPFDIVVNNGILHIIDKPLFPKENIWEFLESTSVCPKLVNYINSLTGFIFDPTIATQIGVDPNSGKPIYDTASGMVWENLFINRTRNLKSEDTLSTVILFNDNDYNAEFDKFREYFTYHDTVTDFENLSDSVTNWKIVKDIVFEGSYSPDHLPATLKSTFGVNINVGNFTIDSIFQASNGYVYIVNNYSVEKEEKIPVIILEGEDTTKYIERDPFGQSGFTREVELASGGYDFILDNHGGNPGSLFFYVPDLCKLKYDIYWKAVDDFDYSIRYPNPDDTIRQSLGWVKFSGFEEDVAIFTDFTNIGNLTPVLDSTYSTAQDKFIARNTIFGYQDWKWIRLMGEGKNRTIALDYIKLVPVFNE